ncbi:MAG TPA: TIGR02680 family protein [Acidimicrobiales bacterium]|nr:TIGR02680 family protein [Acidimicrobiales bacterium]
MAVIEHLSAAPHLPRPRPGRMRPLRAGIRNVWEYDDQEFWFSDGRLILRGQNTAGKSKALELLLPFVLDGDVRSERLDPFGSKAKTMYWNLIEFSDRPTAIGYCWVEFGRVDGDGVEQFTTCVVGLRGVRSAGKRVDTWFAVTPARVGVDLELAPGGVPLTREQFRAALPERSVPSDAARDHRAAVDHALFGLGPDRYDALLHLLLQLRRPKLSEKLDMIRLGEYLSDALPPLERHRMESLASAFARLDEDTDEIERLEASAARLHTFLDDYRVHAAVQTRLRADAVRSANTNFDKVTEDERLQRAEHAAATDALETIETGRAQLAATIERTNGQLQGLDLSKVHALRQVEERADEAEGHATLLSDRALRDREAADLANGRAVTAAGTADAREATRARQAEATEVAADRAELGEPHRLHDDQLVAEPDRARVALAGAADRRQDRLRAVRAASEAANVALARIREGERADAEADAALVAAEEQQAAAEAAREVAAGDLADAVDRWAGEWGVDPSVRPGGDGLAEWVVDQVLAGARPAVPPLLAPARAVTSERQLGVATDRRRADERRGELEAERRRAEADVDAPPPLRPGRPADRPAGHAPLWACVDFATGLGEAERAGLEAALEASGLLDALVGPGGDLLDPSTLDTWIASGEDGGGTGVAGLVPAAGTPVGEAAVRRALAAVGRSGAQVSSDGHWSVGPLRGRWSKASAEHVGAAARAEARRRRLAALAEELGAVDRQLEALAAQEEELAAELQRLDRAEAAWPPADGLRDAHRDVGRAEDAAVAAREARAATAERLAAAREAGQGAIAALSRAEEAAGCPAAGVDDALEALAAYRTSLVELVAAAFAALDARRAADEAEERAGAAEQAAATSGEQADAARAVAAQARGQADELRRTSGADAEAIMARHRHLSEVLDRATADRRQLDQDRDGARDRLQAASTRLEAVEERRRQRERERVEALAALAQLVATELAALALGPVDPDRDLTQVTAGLAFARSAFERLREVRVDQAEQDSVSNRFHNGMTALRSQLGSDFDPYLDTSGGIEVCYATLNGALVGIGELSAALDEQVRRRREMLSAEERELIERHLLTEVGTHLGRRVAEARTLVQRMNEQLAGHPTRSGVSLQLSWEVAADAGPGAEQAVRLLRHEVHLLDQPERALLASFLADRVRTARDEGEGADMVERLATALDYRRWRRFVVHRRSGGQETRLTNRTQGAGSGGEQAKLAHQPLFAATAAYYASARPEAPHLLMLDEAFAGIDDSQRGDCLGMLVDLDLDVVLTNYAEWGCYPEVPAVAIYHLERLPGQPGVTALRFVWDGQVRREDDPWLDRRTEGPTGWAAPEGGGGLGDERRSGDGRGLDGGVVPDGSGRAG